MKKKLVFSVFLFLIISSCTNETDTFPENPSEKMQEFVISISNYAKKVKSDFIIVPQNGIELAFNHLKYTGGVNTMYANAIDGIGIEALFYDRVELPKYDRLTMLQKISERKKVLVSDYITNNSLVNDVIQKNTNEGFICFPRLDYNYDYKFIPDFIVNENVNDINTLSNAQNYLYLINGNDFSSKDDFINNIANTNFDVVLIDLFFHSTALTPEDLAKLKVKKNGGKRLVLSYINIGAAEKYRYYFNHENWSINNPHWLVKPYKGYEDEIFVKFWATEWHQIIYGNNNSYIKKSIDAGFDGAYLDNVKAYHYLFSDEF
ncbi:endo alpha-1,4 polygalactosaminidase [Tenacibaculum sp. TC6]|uniref:endo alpha-1,4 polygalactosaminidase n=1 Tax=Tenacibaculum sp. TC6 TaxID=3423223 RepID=UPI003D360EAB